MKNFLAKIAGRRAPWIILGVMALFFVAIAHFGFEKWLFMPPCEQCVYVRVGYVAFALGAFIVALKPAFVLTKALGALLSLYGAMYSLLAAVTLSKIHAALHSENVDAIFGLQGCSSHPTFPLNLPLDAWCPSLFSVTGDCGIDAPVVPSGTTLTGLQNYFVSLYTASDGWYLFPSMKLMNMADCCAVISVLLIIAVVLLASAKSSSPTGTKNF